MITVKQAIGAIAALAILLSMIMAILGLWGKMDADTMWKLIGTFVVVAGGCSGATTIIDKYFVNQLIEKEVKNEDI